MLGNVAKILGSIVALALLAIAAIWWIGQRGATRQLAGAERQAGTATVAAGQAEASAAATKIIVSGEARDRVDLEVHQANVQAIAAAPGASQPLDPALNAAGRRGLCNLAAYRDDPECARLRGRDPAELPGAGRADPAPW